MRGENDPRGGRARCRRPAGGVRARRPAPPLRPGARHVVRDADGASVRARVHLAAAAVAARPRARAAPIEGGGWRITDR
ncbi:hypothetical protein ID867_24585 [Streptomyces parvulus]|nr:hypothetical protein [Streptomyces parvulus]